MSSIDRRTFFHLSSGAVLSGAVGSALAVGTPTAARAENAGAGSARDFRALWIASVVNIDFPSRTGLSPAALRREFEGWLDLATSWNLNAVISQVRPTADAFWPSPHEPWSQYLTGTQGRDPGYDPLEHQVRAAHDRGLEFHAWFNPYRVSMQADPSRLAAGHPARVHPDWVFAYGGKLYYNPGLPEVRAFVQTAMMDAVERYDIDAVHFDDYFYPYPSGTAAVPDGAAFARYGGGRSLADWRRENINLLVREMRERIRATKPWVRFGISPFGIWRNRSSDPAGSATSGTESYAAISADTRRWVKEGWVDYICPQIYWEIGHPAADYAELVRWWADTVRDTDVALYIGQATYKATSGVFTDPGELTRHLELNTRHPLVAGNAYFSAADLRKDAAGSMSTLVREHYARPAVIPPHAAHLGGCAPEAPYDLSASRTAAGVQLSWTRPSSAATSYAIWRLPDPDASPERLTDATFLVDVVRAAPGETQGYLHRGAPAGGWHTVTAYDRGWHQSWPAPPASA